MDKSAELIKFELKERALQREIADNPLACKACSAWRSAGDMARVLNHCPDCGTKMARRDIESLIWRLKDLKQISFDEAWDIANEFLEKKIKSQHGIYFDEDYFYSDLKREFNL